MIFEACPAFCSRRPLMTLTQVLIPPVACGVGLYQFLIRNMKIIGDANHMSARCVACS